MLFVSLRSVLVVKKGEINSRPLPDNYVRNNLTLISCYELSVDRRTATLYGVKRKIIRSATLTSFDRR